VSPPEEEPAGSIRPRTALIAYTSAALLTLVPIAAYQAGLVKHLADPPGKIFDSDRVAGSPQAHPLGVPDSYLGIASYSVTFGLALLARNSPNARKLLAIKLLMDGTAAGVNVVRQVVTFRRLGSWCSATAICTGAMVFAGRALTCERSSVGAKL
jgi:uncharacterized membrane protein